MGGKSSSSSTTTTQTEQFDERVAAADNAVVIQLRDGSAINVTDPGVLEVFEQGIDAFGGLIDTAVEFSSQQSAQAAGLVRKVLDEDQSEDRQNFEILIKWGAVIAISIAGFQAFGRK